MLGLDKSTELNIELPMENIYGGLKLHPSRRAGIARKIISMTITNQINCIETIEEEQYDRQLFFIKIIMEKMDNSYDDNEVRDYMNYNKGMFSDMIDKMKQEAFYVICDNDNNLRAIFFKERKHFDFSLIDNRFELDIDLNEKDYNKVCKEIISQIDDFNDLKDCKDV